MSFYKILYVKNINFQSNGNVRGKQCFLAYFYPNFSLKIHLIFMFFSEIDRSQNIVIQALAVKRSLNKKLTIFL